MPSFVSAITPEIEQRLESLRASKGLKVVSSDQEGTPLGALPDCIYGFTYSPVNESTPLYAKRQFQCFEIHRLPGAAVHIVGFATAAEARNLASRTPFDFKLFPEPNGDSVTLVEVPLDRVLRAKPVSRGDGNYMPLSIE